MENKMEKGEEMEKVEGMRRMRRCGMEEGEMRRR